MQHKIEISTIDGSTFTLSQTAYRSCVDVLGFCDKRHLIP